MEKLILASASPRRRELLGLIAEDFDVIPAKGEENVDMSLSPADTVKALAKQKAEEVSKEFPDRIVIGADTMVFCEEKALGKPKDVLDAERMLKLLSGRVHSVITAVAVAQNGNSVKLFAEETKVEFYPLSDDEINRYTESGEPMDKAGAYGIQGKGALLVKGIEGDYYNVMGLPVGRLYRELKSLNFQNPL